MNELTDLTEPSTLSLASAASIIREAMKDKSYRATSIGQLVGRYIRWLRNEWGATPSTVRDYEAVLARMSVLLADLEPIQVEVDDLRVVIDSWSERSDRTRAKVTSVIRAFWAWAEEYDYLPASPASKLRRPKARSKAVKLLPEATDARALAAARSPQDRVALLLLFDYGVRRDELASTQPRDFDLSRRIVTVHGKGGKDRVLPIRGRIIEEMERYYLEPLEGVGRTPEPDDFLLYPMKRGAGGRILAAYPKKKMGEPTIHRWWYRRLQEAGIVGKGVTSGMNMHRARHSFAVDLRRVSDLGITQHALGHTHASTTEAAYGHYDLSDLERGIEALWRKKREEPLD